MEERMVKFYSKESNRLALRAIPGHFATSHSHINYYIDMSSMKSRINEAKEAAKVLFHKTTNPAYVDTIVCMDGTEVIGGFLAECYVEGHVLSTNLHETIYVASPEVNANGQLIFRDNTRHMIDGKHAVLLLDTTTTGETIRRCMECVQYYGGIVEEVMAVFSMVDKVDGMKVQSIFTREDVPGYQAYEQHDCPYCARGMRIEAMVNGYGYSKL